MAKRWIFSIPKIVMKSRRIRVSKAFKRHFFSTPTSFELKLFFGYKWNFSFWYWKIEWNEFYFVVFKRKTKMVGLKIGKFNSGAKWYPFTTLWYRHLILYTCEYCVCVPNSNEFATKNKKQTEKPIEYFPSQTALVERALPTDYLLL